jgi:LmbE family N-acetylglucosaminyl deacetylase
MGRFKVRVANAGLKPRATFATALIVTAVFAAAVGVTPRAQLRVVPIDAEQGHVALGLVLRHLANAGVLMMATAHPDDENNGLLVQLNRGQGYRTALATATRGNGGQNEIGPEIFEALGVLRTEELAALHRFDGAEQYFTRAVDFGYSFGIEETFDKWGRDEIVGDYVRLIRMIRPDVMVAMNPSGDGGGQHHQASAILSREAYRLAGDPSKYSEQLKDGLHPWRPKKFYFNSVPTAGNQSQPPGPTCRINLAAYDSLLGKTHAEIGTEARSMHKCQGMAQLLALPGPSAATYQLVETTLPGQMQRNETSLFEGIDSTIVGLAQFAGSKAPKELSDGLSAISSAVQTAQKKFDGETHDSIVQPLLAGLHAVRTLRGQLRKTTIDDASRDDIDLRLRQKEAEFQQALLLANAVRVEALADDGVVVPGQPVKISILVANNGSADVDVKQVKLSGFEGDGACTLTEAAAGFGRGARGGRGGRGSGGRGERGGTEPASPPISTLKKGIVGRCEVVLKVPDTARVSEPYWHRAGEAGRYTFDDDAPFGLPFRPTPFNAHVTLGFSSDPAREEVIDELPIQYRYEGDIFSGEKRSELLVVPAFSVRMSPEIAIVPVASLPTVPTVARGKTRASDREIRVTVVNDRSEAAEGVVKLNLPVGWSATPAQQSLRFARQDESQTVRFAIKPPADTALGAYHVRAIVSSGGQTFDRGYQTIEYPHIRRQHIYHDADVMVKVINVKTAPNLTVGYIVGVGDEVPTAIDQLGRICARTTIACWSTSTRAER